MILIIIIISSVNVEPKRIIWRVLSVDTCHFIIITLFTKKQRANYVTITDEILFCQNVIWRASLLHTAHSRWPRSRCPWCEGGCPAFIVVSCTTWTSCLARCRHNGSPNSTRTYCDTCLPLGTPCDSNGTPQIYKTVRSVLPPGDQRQSPPGDRRRTLRLRRLNTVEIMPK